MRVDDLVSERSVGEVGPLRDVEDLLDGRLGELAALGGPELAEDSEEGGLSAAVRSGDEQVHAWLDLKVHFADELVTVRAVNRDVLKDDVIRELNLSTLRRVLLDLVGLSGGLVVDVGSLRHHYALVAATGKII